MAQGTGITDVGLKVSKQDFLDRIAVCDQKMGKLMDVIERYNRAKSSLSQFIQESDITFQLMLDRIEENVKAAKKSYNALQATKVSLEEVVSKMETMGNEAQNTLQDAIGAVGSVVNSALQISDVL